MWKSRNYYIDVNNWIMNCRSLKYKMWMDFYSRYLNPTAAQSSKKMLAWFIHVSKVTTKADASMKKTMHCPQKKEKTAHLFYTLIIREKFDRYHSLIFIICLNQSHTESLYCKNKVPFHIIYIKNLWIVIYKYFR